MSRLDGELRSDYPSGGSGDFELARQALLYNVSDYLTDPVDPSELGKSLEAVRRGFASEDRPAAMAQDDQKASVQEPAPSCPIVSTIKQYVDEQLHHNITLKRISDSLNFNCAYLGQKFKQQENMSFNEYLLRQRMEKAKLLLETTDMKIYEIADAVGYTEIDWFYKNSENTPEQVPTNTVSNASSQHEPAHL